MNARTRISAMFAFALLAMSAAFNLSCLTSQNNSTLDAIDGSQSAQPIVEAYFEYGGPQQKWAGPSTVVIHVVAREGMAHVSVTPALTGGNADGPTLDNRAPASATAEGTTQGSTSMAAAISAEAAREKLARVALAMEGDQQGFQGCMYPVRARMIRMDGSVVEKHGCRTQLGWPGAVSGVVAELVAYAK